MCLYPAVAVAETGAIPSGNAPGATKFQSRSARPKADIKLTAGKAINVPIETLIDQVVKQNKVGMGDLVGSILWQLSSYTLPGAAVCDFNLAFEANKCMVTMGVW